MKPYNNPEPLRQLKPSSSENIRIVPALENPLEIKGLASIQGYGRARQLSGIREASKESRTSEPEKSGPPLDSQDNSAGTNTSSQDKSVESPPVGHDATPSIPLHSYGSTASLPLTSLPQRRSSRRISRRRSEAFISSEGFPTLDPPPPNGYGHTIPRRGKPTSPVRAVAQYDGVSSDSMRRMPSRTFVRSAKPTDILDVPIATHPRVELNLKVAAPLFVGGGTVEGLIRLTVDSSVTTLRKKIKRIMIVRISVDVVGVEEMSDGRKCIFLSLANELVDERHPPPVSLITTPTAMSQAEPFWIMKSAAADIPFQLNLPLNVGPPPYNSKHARIRYIICSTVLIKVNGKQHIVRQSLDIAVLTVFDPERALANLPNPLIATDEMQLPGILRTHSVKLTAGLHRQTWVDGANIFIDVHILNNSSKVIKRLEIQLEKMTLFFAHPAAGTIEKSVQHLRLPSRNENELIAKMIVKKDKVWNGVQARSSEIRTCELVVPKGHVTIGTGRYFEVRYFLNVSITVSMFKVLQVQLPVTLIHMNSLDIVPNSLAQVTAAIADKRSQSLKRRSSFDPAMIYTQGQAFTAPRHQSISQERRPIDMDDELDGLRRELDDSPRKLMRSRAGTARSYHSMNQGPNNAGPQLEERAQSHDVSHCHRRHASSGSSVPRLPRIQVSTSGLGFSDSDFEISPIRPKNIFYNDLIIAGSFQKKKRTVLTERERREIKLEKELSGARRRSREHQVPWGWRNVAAERIRGRPVVQSAKSKGKAKAVWVDQ